MAPRTLPAFEKTKEAYIEDASLSKTATATTAEQDVVIREFDPKFMRKTMLKVL